MVPINKMKPNTKDSPKSRNIKNKKKPVVVKPMTRTRRQIIIASNRRAKRDDFEIDWPRVEVPDKTIKKLAEYLCIDDEAAFDKAFDILEAHNSFRVDSRMVYREMLKKRYRGDWIHLQWHSYENLQIGIENNRWTRVFFDSQSLFIPEEISQQVYYAEDGRCEQCGQAMHYRVANFIKRDPTIFGDQDNIKLVCYSCKHNRKNALLHPDLIIADRNMDFLMLRFNFSCADEVKAYLRNNLKYAVHMNTFNPNKQNGQQTKNKIIGQYWLPGIGKARLKREHFDGRKRFILEFVECSSSPQIRIQPQKRSRNLII